MHSPTTRRVVDSTLDFGVVARPEPSQASAGSPREWLKIGVARILVPQDALYEIGSAVTLFQVRKHDTVFRSYLDAATDETFEAETQKQPNATTHATVEDAVTDEPNAERIDQHTRDFIARVLLTDLSDREFEEFTADLLRAWDTGPASPRTPRTAAST